MAPSEEVNIPQKPPMVMVDRLIEVNDQAPVTEFLIRDDNVFVENGVFREAGLIENMAQTAAAGAGAKPEMAGKEARVGFIGGIRNLAIHSLPKVGDCLETRITMLHEVFDARIVQGEVLLQGHVIASCELKIFFIAS